MKETISIYLLVLFSMQNLSAQSNLVAGVDINAPSAFEPQASRMFCDTIFSFPTVDTWPTGITSDGNYIFNGGNNSDFIYKYSFTGGVVDSFLNPAAAATTTTGGDMDFDGTDLLVLSESTDSVYRMNPNTGALISQFDVAPCTGDCHGLAYDGTFIWVCNYIPQYLYKLDAITGAVLNSFPLSVTSLMLPVKFIDGALYGLGISPPTIFELDTATGNVISSQPWCLGYPLGLCKANNSLWGLSSQSTNRIYQFETSIVTQAPVTLHEDNSFQIFPNPSSGNATISLRDVTENSALEIYDLLGEKIYSEYISGAMSKEINLQNVSPGIYFARLYAGEKMYTRKLIVQ